MRIPFLHRRARIDDPFAAEGANWAEKVMRVLICFVFFFVCVPGFFMFVGFSVYFAYGGPMKQWMRWAWPVWGGVCAVVGGFLLAIAIVYCFQPCVTSHRRRIDERRRRRWDLLQSNRMLTRLPRPEGVPPAVELAIAEAFRNQGDLESQNAAITAAQNPPVVAPTLEPPVEPEELTGVKDEKESEQKPPDEPIAKDDTSSDAAGAKR